VVGRERCFSELGGHSWGLYGENCEKRSDDEDQQPAHYVPDTLHGAYGSFYMYLSGDMFCRRNVYLNVYFVVYLIVFVVRLAFRLARMIGYYCNVGQ